MSKSNMNDQLNDIETSNEQAEKGALRSDWLNSKLQYQNDAIVKSNNIR